MDRRSFLKLFAAAGPVAAVAPTYFFAPVGGWDLEAHNRAKLAEIAKLYHQSWLVNMVQRDTERLREQFWYCHPAQRAAIEALTPMHLWGLQYVVSSGGTAYAGIERNAASRANPRRGLMNAAS